MSTHFQYTIITNIPSPSLDNFHSSSMLTNLLMFEIHYRSCFLISLSSDLLHAWCVADLLQLVDCRAAAGGAAGAADDAVEEGDHGDD